MRRRVHHLQGPIGIAAPQRCSARVRIDIREHPAADKKRALSNLRARACARPIEPDKRHCWHFIWRVPMARELTTHSSAMGAAVSLRGRRGVTDGDKATRRGRGATAAVGTQLLKGGGNAGAGGSGLRCRGSHGGRACSGRGHGLAQHNQGGFTFADIKSRPSSPTGVSAVLPALIRAVPRTRRSFTRCMLPTHVHCVRWMCLLAVSFLAAPQPGPSPGLADRGDRRRRKVAAFEQISHGLHPADIFPKSSI